MIRMINDSVLLLLQMLLYVSTLSVLQWPVARGEYPGDGCYEVGYCRINEFENMRTAVLYWLYVGRRPIRITPASLDIIVT